MLRSTLWSRALARALCLLLTLSLLLPAAPAAAQPAPIEVACLPAALVAAIAQANASPEHDLIRLEAGCAYSLSAPHADGASAALPRVTQPLTIEGAGATIARPDGGARMRLIEAAAELTLRDLTLSGAHAPPGFYGGALVAFASAPLRLEGVTLANNRADYGGAVAHTNTLAVVGGALRDNRAEAGDGGAIHARGELRVEGARFTRNSAGGSGGAIYTRPGAATTIVDGAFSYNEAEGGSGGVIYAGDSLTLADVAIERGEAAQSGGGVYARGPLSVDRGSFVANRAGGDGGAIYAAAALELRQSYMEQNHTLGAQAASRGGAIYATAGLSLERSALRGNWARQGADAVYLPGGAGVVARISNNLLEHRDYGPNATGLVACIFCGPDPGDATAELDHNTFVSRSPRYGMALKVDAGSAILRSSIVSGFAVGLQRSGGAARSLRNLYFDNAADMAGLDLPDIERDVFGQDPRFVDRLRGDYRLQRGSPAWDSGPDLGVALDLQGVHRAQGRAPDLGAFEVDEGAFPASHVAAVGCDPAALVEAIAAANARPGADRLELAAGCAYSLGQVHSRRVHWLYREPLPLGLPQISEQLEIAGNGATIRRAEGAPEMAFLSATGASLRLSDLALAGSRAPGPALLFRGRPAQGSELRLDGVTIRDGVAHGIAGALLAEDVALTIEGSRFLGNRSELSCGAVCVSRGQASVRASRFEGNRAGQYAGALLLEGGSLLVQDSVFARNSAASVSGLMVDYTGAPARLVNNVWYDNQADVASGVVQAGLVAGSEASIELLHNSFLNTASNPGVAASIRGTGTLTLTNSIVAGFSLGVIGGAESQLVVGRNLFWGAEPRGDAIVADPLFADQAGGDLRLRAGSPAIDAGLEAGVTVDLAGVARPQGQGDDLGAYEYAPGQSQQPGPTPPAPSPTPARPAPTPSPPPATSSYQLFLPLLRR